MRPNKTFLKMITVLMSFAAIIFCGCGCDMQRSGGMLEDADTSDIKEKYLDVAYASKSSSQKLDIYLPNNFDGPYPVIIQIHGGAFKSGDKASGELTPVLNALDRGYAVVAVNYRLSGESVFPAQINDIKAAIRFLRTNAGIYRLNSSKFAVWGGSAGGNLSALVVTTGEEKELQDDSLGNSDQSDKVQAVVDWFGPIYFSKMDSEFSALGITPVGKTSTSTSPESEYLGKTVGSKEAEALVIKASPQSYIDVNDPPFFIQHGTADKNIPITQSVNFYNNLIPVLGDSKVIYEAISGAGHGGSKFETSENINKVLNFLDTWMK